MTVRRSRIFPARSPSTVYLLAALLALAAIGCAGTGEKKAARTVTTSNTCRPLPLADGPIAWVPADLPLPSGTYPVRDENVDNGVHHGVFATPVPIKEFVRFAVTEWPAKGWRMGRGDSEANEAEDGFARAGEGGSFKVRADYCDPTWSELNLFYKAG